MRRWILAGLAICLLLSMAAVAAAAEDTMTVSGGQAEPGDFVYLAVKFNSSVKGNTVGVACKYDPEVLKPQPALCQWSKQGILQDFDTDGNGVWAGSDWEELEGTVCILAFQVIGDAVFSESEVQCTVVVKNDSQQVGSYSAKAMVTCSSNGCEHSYGSWTNGGMVGHVRVCSKCDAQRTEAHKWDEGVLSDSAQNPGMEILTNTCSVCGGTKTTQIPTGSKPDEETQLPSETEPEDVVHLPQEGVTIPSDPSSGQSTGEGSTYPEQSGQTGTQDAQGSHIPDASESGSVSHDHTPEREESTPASDHGHIHKGTDAGTENSGGNLLIVLGVFAVAVTAGIVFLKKKS